MAAINVEHGAPELSRAPFLVRVRAHLSIARLDHSIKNVFVLPGILVPLTIIKIPFDLHLLLTICKGFIAITLIACSNYVINEVLDAPFDRLHPTKKMRPAALGLVDIPLAYLQWILMMLAGVSIGLTISVPFAITAAALWIMGCVYNIKPFRTKDMVYLDVLTESVNNPIRMLLGWFMVTSTLVPPASLLLSYWMIGCYFMALKRFSEYREIGHGVAMSYRESFKFYTERSLLGSVTFYGSVAMLFFGAFIMRYRLELIISFPFVAMMMATYFNMAFDEDSAAQSPEKLYRNPSLMIQTLITSAVILAMLHYRIPALERFFAPTLPPSGSAISHL
jgi:4-hydroxybenzoate polyprenyltransferase